MKIQFLSFIFLSFLFLGCNGQSQKKYLTIPASIFSGKIIATKNPQIIDVRSPKEFEGQHLDNAKNCNWNGLDFEKSVAQFDRSKPVFVYCMSGGRSTKAAIKLQELGFESIFELEGGIIKWNAAGLDTPTDKIIGVCSQEYQELLHSDKKVLIDFYADWCAPCQKMAPYLLKMQTEMADKMVIIRLNADENKTMVKELKIGELPALILYKNNEVIWQHRGFINEEDLKKQL